MPCLLVVLALAAPRLVVAFLWFLTGWFAGMFASILWPLAGFIFLPTTLLWYSAVLRWFNGQWTLWPIVGLIVALAIDLSPVRGRRRRSD